MSVSGSWVSMVPLTVAVAVALLFIIGALVGALNYVMEENMERSERIPQLYGYAVCLIAVVTFLFAAANVVAQIFTLDDPLSSGGASAPGGQSLRSFQAFRDTYATQVDITANAQKPRLRPSDAVLRRQYEAERADHIAQQQFTALQSLVNDAVLIIIAALLFGFHWRWLQRRTHATS